MLAAVPSPYDYEGIISAGTFGQKLYRLCRGESAQDTEGKVVLETLFPEFEKNYDTVVAIQQAAPYDRFLSKLVNYVSKSGLSDEKKHERYRVAYDRCLQENDWNDTLCWLVFYAPNSFSKDEISKLLASKDKSVRMGAERALKMKYFKDRGERRDPVSNRQRGFPSKDTSATLRDGPNGGLISSIPGVCWTIGVAVVALLAALTWWLKVRAANPNNKLNGRSSL
jgi:hypothetical protein